jgi:diaminohydroxyphosphoribosylaminopyrimidine deaminase / 5-amino-6-(5-phosphoribosylamino)uracil reductase
VSDPTARAADGVLLPVDVYRRALTVGRRAAGVSGPNPPVGCVLVREGLVIAEGATRPVGQEHAEVVALDAAGDAAHGATAVVTLEPCAHHGRTPPCVDALIAAGVREVHVLLRDPDPAAGGGIARLLAAGIAVVDVAAQLPELAAAAAHDLRGFLVRVRSGRPHVTLKIAQDVDGGTVPPAGGYLTGEDARRRVHLLRAESDAVLVGGGTVRADDPQLDVRIVASDRSPRAVVISATADVSPDARVARSGSIVLVGPRADDTRCAALRAADVTVERVGTSRDERGVDLGDALRRLLDHRVLTVLAEPGPVLASALLAEGLVDVVELHVARGAKVASVRPCLDALAGMLDADAAEREVTADGDLILRADATRLVRAQERPALEEVA